MSTEPAGGTISGNSSDTNTITDRQLFDHAISPPDRPAPSPDHARGPTPTPSEPSTPSSDAQASEQPASTRPDLQQQPEQQQQPGQQPRAPDGKFAPKPQGQPQGQQHNVPLAELLKERDARQRLEAHAQELTRAVMDLQQRLSPQQPQQPQGPETIFDDPRAYLEQNVMQPLRQEGQMYMMKVRDDLSREQANMQFGAQEVNAALASMQQIRHTPQGNFVFSQIMSSGHPYGQLVQWHRQARAQAAIGADPQAWVNKQAEVWAQNEKYQDYVADLRAKRLGAQQARPPNVQLPPSLSSVRSSSGRMDNGGDLSSASLYDFATK